jgi:hypothetical protein
MARIFVARLEEWNGPAAWHFIEVPAEDAPDFAGAFGRVPVTATVDGKTWSTSVWREKDGRWLMPVPKKIRGGKGDGDLVGASLEVDTARL